MVDLLGGSIVFHLEVGTGKSVSEALILESVNPQYDERLIVH